MTTQFILIHKFEHIPMEKFEKYLNDPKLNDLLEQKLDFKSRKLTKKTTKKNGSIEWIFDVQKQAELPASIKKFFLDGAISWQEISTFIPDEHIIHWQITPNSKTVKFEGKGTWRLEKLKNGCQRTIEGNVTINIPLLGKFIENFIVNELKKSYEIEPLVQKLFYDSID